LKFGFGGILLGQLTSSFGFIMKKKENKKNKKFKSKLNSGTSI